MRFEWDPAKDAKNIQRHRIAFADAVTVFGAGKDVLTAPSKKPGEARWVALGVIAGLIIAVVYTERGDAYRIISARRAKRNERKRFQAAFPNADAW